MAEISTESSSPKKGKKKGVKKVSTRIDLTPMVDLGFLLITFFMLTTTLIKPQTMEIAMPSKKNVPEAEQTKVKASRAITIILGKDNEVFYYEGTRENGVDPEVQKTDFSSNGIRKFLIQRNFDVIQKVEELKNKENNQQLNREEFEKHKQEAMDDKKAPIVIIKATDDATYKNLIDILDEMAICNIGKYAIVDLSAYDKELLKENKLDTLTNH
jgi:biopolymer transport protein ExbD